MERHDHSSGCGCDCGCDRRDFLAALSAALGGLAFTAVAPRAEGAVPSPATPSLRIGQSLP